MCSVAMTSECSFDDVRSTLIELVHENEALWNQKNKCYHTTRLPEKKAKWEEIGVVLNINGDLVQQMWKSLRSQFVREFQKKTKPKSGAGGGFIYTGSWPFFQALLFLKDTIEPRKTSGNLQLSSVSADNTIGTSENGSTSNSVSVPNNDVRGSKITTIKKDVSTTERYKVPETETKDDDVETMSNLDVDPEQECDNEEYKRSNAGSSLKRKKTVTRALELEERKAELFHQRMASKNRELQLREMEKAKEEDADFLFLKSLLPHMKKANDNFGLRMKIMETIKNFLDEESWMTRYTEENISVTLS